MLHILFPWQHELALAMESQGSPFYPYNPSLRTAFQEGGEGVPQSVIKVLSGQKVPVGGK